MTMRPVGLTSRTNKGAVHLPNFPLPEVQEPRREDTSRFSHLGRPSLLHTPPNHPASRSRTPFKWIVAAMTGYFNDSPIETPADDRYGITPFATSIAKSILNMKAPEGTTIALHGPWGSGKSSAVNLIRNALDEARDQKLVVTEFNGWWYRGDATLKKGLGDKIKDFIPKITRRLLQAGPVVGTASSLMGQPWIAMLSSTVSTFGRNFFR